MSKRQFSFKIKTNIFFEALKRASQIIKNTKDPIKVVYIEVANNEVMIRAINRSYSQEYRELLNADSVKGQGQISLPIEIKDFFRRCEKEEVEIFVQEDIFFVKGQKVKGEFSIIKVKYDPFIVKSDMFFFNGIVEKKQLVKILDKLYPFLNKKSVQESLTGLLFIFEKDGKLVNISTDGNALGKIESQYVVTEENGSIVKEPIEFIMPYDSVKFLKKVLKRKRGSKVEIKIGKIFFGIKNDTFEYYGKINKKKYPDWQSVIQTKFNGSIKFKTEYFNEAVKKILSETNSRAKKEIICFSFWADAISNNGNGRKGKIRIESRNKVLNKGVFEFLCNYSGDKKNLVLYLNGNYLKNFLKYFKKTEIEINYIDNISPLLIKDEDEEFLFLIMPVSKIYRQ